MSAVPAQLTPQEPAAPAVTMSGRIDTVKGFLKKQRESLRPWNEVFAKPSVPSAADARKRLAHNVQHFKANYILLSLVLAAYCVLSNPLLLFGLAFAVAGSVFAASRSDTEPLNLFGQALSKRDILLATAVLSVPMLYMAGVGSTVFWLIGATLAISAAHAAVIPVADNPLSDIM
eukprot:m.20171 g.20171  ORF g.20171 m.20171 type:complete len:175 (-) comp6105_c1_seq1:223-747(-)